MNSEKAARPGSQLLTSGKARGQEVRAHDSFRVRSRRATCQACVLGPEGGLTAIASCAESASGHEARRLNRRSDQGRSEPAGDPG